MPPPNENRDFLDRAAPWLVPLGAGIIFVTMMATILIIAIHMSGCSTTIDKAPSERGIIFKLVLPGPEPKCTP